MTVYVVGGIKGGTGKTTLATNLAVMLSYVGRDVLFVDADDQESGTMFNNWRSERLGDDMGYTAVQMTGLSIRAQVRALAPKYDDIIIDVGGRDTESQRASLTLADVALFPFSPTSLSVWTVEALGRMLREVMAFNTSMKAYAFINHGVHIGKDNEEAAAVLQSYDDLTFLATSLGNRKAFSNAAAVGLSVIEITPFDKKAIAEIDALFKAVTGFDSPSAEIEQAIRKGAA